MKKRIEKNTRRLQLRPYRASDYKQWKHCFSAQNKLRNQWDLEAKPLAELTREKFKLVLDTQKEYRDSDTFYDFIAFDKRSGEIIGHVAIMDISRAVFQNAYLGYRVFSRNWGKGYGKEMVAGAMQIAFKNLKLHRLEAGIEPNNRRSIALAKSLRMRREGYSKRRLFLKEQWLDMVIYAITAEELGVKGITGRLTKNRS